MKGGRHWCSRTAAWNKIKKEWWRQAPGHLREAGKSREKSGENASQVYLLRPAAARKTLRGVSHLLFLRNANRSLGQDQIRENYPREDSRVHHRAAENRPRFSARPNRFLVRNRERIALAVASVRSPSDRNQLRAAEPALREIQAGQARIRAAGFVGPRVGGGGILRVAFKDVRALREGVESRDSSRGCAFRAAQRRADEFSRAG